MRNLELDMTTSHIHAKYTMMDTCIAQNKSRVQIRQQLHSLRYWTRKFGYINTVTVPKLHGYSNTVTVSKTMGTINATDHALNFR